jgi:hypothetical protein
MPTTVSQLFQSAKINLTGTVKWRERVPSQADGVYVVSLSADSTLNAGILENAPISLEAVRKWVIRVPKIELDNLRNPEPEAIAERLSRFWLPDENIVYIGKTDAKLVDRLKDYHTTELGNRRPHARGHWIKTLTNLESLYIHFAECSMSEWGKIVESFLLKSFINGVSNMSRSVLRDPEHPFPFANLEYPKGNRKKHGIGKSKM